MPGRGGGGRGGEGKQDCAAMGSNPSVLRALFPSVWSSWPSPCPFSPLPLFSLLPSQPPTHQHILIPTPPPPPLPCPIPHPHPILPAALTLMLFLCRLHQRQICVKCCYCFVKKLVAMHFILVVTIHKTKNKYKKNEKQLLLLWFG